MTFSEGITWRGLAGVARLAWLAKVRLSFLCLGLTRRSPLLSYQALKDTLRDLSYAFCDLKLNGTKESSEGRGKMTIFFRGDGDH